MSFAAAYSTHHQNTYGQTQQQRSSPTLLYPQLYHVPLQQIHEEESISHSLIGQQLNSNNNKHFTSSQSKSYSPLSLCSTASNQSYQSSLSSHSHLTDPGSFSSFNTESATAEAMDEYKTQHKHKQQHHTGNPSVGAAMSRHNPSNSAIVGLPVIKPNQQGTPQQQQQRQQQHVQSSSQRIVQPVPVSTAVPASAHRLSSLDFPRNGQTNRPSMQEPQQTQPGVRGTWMESPQSSVNLVRNETQELHLLSMNHMNPSLSMVGESGALSIPVAVISPPVASHSSTSNVVSSPIFNTRYSSTASAILTGTTGPASAAASAGFTHPSPHHPPLNKRSLRRSVDREKHSKAEQKRRGEMKMLFDQLQECSQCVYKDRIHILSLAIQTIAQQKETIQQLEAEKQAWTSSNNNSLGRGTALRQSRSRSEGVGGSTSVVKKSEPVDVHGDSGVDNSTMTIDGVTWISTTTNPTSVSSYRPIKQEDIDNLPNAINKRQRPNSAGSHTSSTSSTSSSESVMVPPSQPRQVRVEIPPNPNSLRNQPGSAASHHMPSLSPHGQSGSHYQHHQQHPRHLHQHHQQRQQQTQLRIQRAVSSPADVPAPRLFADLTSDHANQLSSVTHATDTNVNPGGVFHGQASGSDYGRQSVIRSPPLSAHYSQNDAGHSYPSAICLSPSGSSNPSFIHPPQPDW